MPETQLEANGLRQVDQGGQAGWTRKAMRWLDVSGRSRRRSYWLFLFAYVAGSLVLGAVGREALGESLGGVQLIGFLAPLPFGATLAARRLHDVGRSGKWVVLPVAPLLIWLAVLPLGNGSQLLFNLFQAACVVAVLAFLWMVASDGTPGPNRYGPDPKDRASLAVEALAPSS